MSNKMRHTKEQLIGFMNEQGGMITQLKKRVKELEDAAHKRQCEEEERLFRSNEQIVALQGNLRSQTNAYDTLIKVQKKTVGVLKNKHEQAMGLVKFILPRLSFDVNNAESMQVLLAKIAETI